MSDIVIKAENLGKKYTIGHQAENGRYLALRDVLMQNARTIWNKTKDLATGKPIMQGDTTEEIWALKDVCFEIRHGEAIGIIGRNGAGKSTLLKVLSRITEPSTGRVTINGRVASLLEVGTGFHPELTGRENIYLNGTILGMTRKEIKRKFDEIVAFAEVEKYLDTPVKRYSSGMYVRLAFAVAAHLEPEILVVDEVLAVGDAAFQKKCLGKMGDVAKKGRTILFVSHNMLAIRGLTKLAILLGEGQVQCAGNVEMVIEKYLTQGREYLPNEIDTSDWERPIEGLGTDLKVTMVCLHSTAGQAILRCKEPMIIEMCMKVTRRIENVSYGYAVFSLDGIRLFQCHNTNEGHPLPYLETGKYRVTAIIDRLPLPPGRYRLGIGVRCDAKGLDWIDDLMLFEVEESQNIETPWFKATDGLFCQNSRWEYPEAIL